MRSIDLQLFSRCLFAHDDVIELRYLHPTGDVRQVRHQWVLAGRLHELVKPALLNRTHNVYVGANPRREYGDTKADGVDLARCLFAEWDDTTLLQASRRIDEAGLPLPTCVVWSGGGVHAYWRLTQPIHDLGEWSCYQKRLIRLLDSDKCIHDAPRIMRVPCFFNHKPGRTDSRLIYADPANVHELEHLLACMPVMTEDPRPAGPVKPVNRINSIKPGDLYNCDDHYEGVLCKHGWRRFTSTETRRYWTRPGKDQGISAVSNRQQSGAFIFYVFSTSASPFTAGQVYRPFSILALLECGGDFHHAANMLRGYMRAA